MPGTLEGSLGKERKEGDRRDGLFHIERRERSPCKGDAVFVFPQFAHVGAM